MQNPQVMAGLVAQLAQNNPELMRAIQQNPQGIQQLFNDPQMFVFALYFILICCVLLRFAFCL